MDAPGGVLVVLSNLLALPVALRWYRWGHGIVPLFFFGVLLFSPSYHHCDSFDRWCVFGNYSALHDGDFWFAQMVVTLSILHLIHWVSPDPRIAVAVGVPFLQTAFIFFFGLVNAMLIYLMGTSTLGQMITVGLAVFTLFVYLIGYRSIHGKWPRYNYGDLLIGISFSGSSILLFNFQNEVPEMYNYIHSAWHALGLCGAYYWVSVMPKYPPLLNIGSPIDNAFYAIGESQTSWDQTFLEQENSEWEGATHNGEFQTELEYTMIPTSNRASGTKRRPILGEDDIVKVRSVL